MCHKFEETSTTTYILWIVCQRNRIEIRLRLVRCNQQSTSPKIDSCERGLRHTSMGMSTLLPNAHNHRHTSNMNSCTVADNSNPTRNNHHNTQYMLIAHNFRISGDMFSLFIIAHQKYTLDTHTHINAYKTCTHSLGIKPTNGPFSKWSLCKGIHFFSILNI